MPRDTSLTPVQRPTNSPAPWRSQRVLCQFRGTRFRLLTASGKKGAYESECASLPTESASLAPSHLPLTSPLPPLPSSCLFSHTRQRVPPVTGRRRNQATPSGTRPTTSRAPGGRQPLLQVKPKPSILNPHLPLLQQVSRRRSGLRIWRGMALGITVARQVSSGRLTEVAGPPRTALYSAHYGLVLGWISEMRPTRPPWPPEEEAKALGETSGRLDAERRG